ncbi:MAG TPA: PAS domain-containing protein [Methanoregulaceae archaeon]|nr:PAS domain-containing protein [Methanoregulaceae archaeon]
MLSVLVIGDNLSLEEAKLVMAGTSDDIHFTLVASIKDAIKIEDHVFDLVMSDYSLNSPMGTGATGEFPIKGISDPIFLISRCSSFPGRPDNAHERDDKNMNFQDINQYSNDKENPSREKARTMFSRLGSRISMALEKTSLAEQQKKQQARICSILASIRTGVFIVDPQLHTILHVNEYALQLMKVAKKEIVGLDYHMVLSLTNNLSELDDISDEGVVKSEGELHDQQGNTIPVIVNVTPIRISSMNNLLITFLDNSIPKLAEKALKESEMRFGILVDTSPDAILLTDLSGVILKTNANASNLFGFPAEEDMNNSDLHALFYPGEPSLTRNFIKSVIEKGVIRKECTGYSVNGNRIPVELSSSVIKDSDGRPISIIHVLRDLTQQKKTEEKLRASEERYRNVIEDQTEFICRFRPDGTHVFVNGAYCRYFGKIREEIIGSRFIPHIHPDDRKGLKNHFASLTPEHQVASFDHRIIMPDGEIRWQRWSDRAIYDKDGKIIEYQSVGRDITAWKHDKSHTDIMK